MRSGDRSCLLRFDRSAESPPPLVSSPPLIKHCGRGELCNLAELFLYLSLSPLTPPSTPTSSIYILITSAMFGLVFTQSAL